MPDERKPMSVVYIYQAEGTARIKIGWSRRLKQRSNTLQTSSPFPLHLLRAIDVEDGASLEATLHERYRLYRQYREWFELPKDVLEALLLEDFTDFDPSYEVLPDPNSIIIPSENVDLLRRYAPTLAIQVHKDAKNLGLPNPSECWPWDGKIAKSGYGTITVQDTEERASRVLSVHRYMFDTLVGPIIRTHVILQRCKNRLCWNPFHLEGITHTENRARKLLA
jgi:Meiotically up-regulated gene 113